MRKILPVIIALFVLTACTADKADVFSEPASGSVPADTSDSAKSQISGDAAEQGISEAADGTDKPDGSQNSESGKTPGENQSRNEPTGTAENTGGDGDTAAFEKYFKAELNAADIKVSESSLQYYGESQGFRIYSAAYDGQLHMEALCSETIGGYTFCKNVQYLPYPLAIYAVKDGEVYTLNEAYEKNLIKIEEVYGFVPDSVKSEQ